MSMREVIPLVCPRCKQEVEVAFKDGGVACSPDYVLIADWVYHTECWDEVINEHPL